MPLKPHPTDPDKLVYVPRQYDLPTKRDWVGLTQEEKNELSMEMVKAGKSVNWLTSQIEAKLKERNT
jgi:hypothetical protein